MKKYVRFGCAAILAAVVATGCGNSGNSGASLNNSVKYDMTTTETMAAAFDNEMGMASEEYRNEAEYEEGWESEEAESSQTASDRKLIKTVSMDVETEEFDSLISKLQSRIGGLGGYVESSSTNNSSYYVNNGRYANYVIRIPANRLDELVGNVTDLANVTWKEENVEDITLRYVDIESHKIALQTEQERLLVLMERAETVEDLITIESRLSEIRYQIQNYESTLRTYDNQVNYSTLHLSISEVKKLTPQEEPGVWERIQDGFTENLEDVVIGVRDFFVDVVIAIPYFVIWGVVLLLGYWIGRRLIKKGNRGKGEKRFWKLKKSRTDEKFESQKEGRNVEFTEKTEEEKK